ncbi:low molecular weight phosphatase family protein [Micromonospora arborensis]|uniref:hypothetical protein n=1 Tax=Micromonospora arborensis TaxID=2116518 RepID=UPI003710A5FD
MWSAIDHSITARFALEPAWYWADEHGLVNQDDQANAAIRWSTLDLNDQYFNPAWCYYPDLMNPDHHRHLPRQPYRTRPCLAETPGRRDHQRALQGRRAPVGGEPGDDDGEGWLVEHHRAGDADADHDGVELTDGLHLGPGHKQDGGGDRPDSHQRPPAVVDVLGASDVIVTMGCGDACPVLAGKRYLDWDIPDPAGRDLPFVRTVRDDIGARVRALIDELTLSTS